MNNNNNMLALTNGDGPEPMDVDQEHHQRPDNVKEPGDDKPKNQDQPLPQGQNHRQQERQKAEEVTRKYVDKVNAPYKMYMNRVATDSIQDAAADVSETNKKLFASMVQKRETEQQSKDSALSKTITDTTAKNNTSRSAVILSTGLVGANARAAVLKAADKVDRKAIEERDNVIARAATSLIGTPCVIKNCPHLGSREHAGLCKERHWKTLTRIPQDAPAPVRESIKADRKRARMEATLARREAKMARLMDIVDQQAQQDQQDQQDQQTRDEEH